MMERLAKAEGKSLAEVAPELVPQPDPAEIALSAATKAAPRRKGSQGKKKSTGSKKAGKQTTAVVKKPEPIPVEARGINRVNR